MAEQVAAVLIAGPTASGKSALAIDLAGRTGGVILNADSMQVYRDLRVLTARPSLEEEARVPHGLYGHVDGALNFSVGHYIAAAASALRDAEAAGQLPVFVGGTGLYFKALTDGLSDIPPVPDEVREQVRRRAEGRPVEELWREAVARDPEGAARLRPTDPLRILRALEVLEATGRPLSSYLGSRRPGPLAGRAVVKIFLAPDRAWLRARIDDRFAAMVETGALAEAEALMRRGLDPALPVMRAHGVPGLIAHLRGEATLDEAIAKGAGDTRAYAKRQFTWFRHQMPGWTWVAPEEARHQLTLLIGAPNTPSNEA
jgi:tRNA dimethylallyltransferase